MKKSVFRIRINFLRIRIRIQRLRLETNTDPDPIRIQGFNDQKLKKNYSWKKKLNFFWSKTAIYLSLGLHKVCPGYRRSLQLTKEAIQHCKTWIFPLFVGHFCPPGSGSGFRIRIHWPDWIRIQSGSGSGSETLWKIYWESAKPNLSPRPQTDSPTLCATWELTPPPFFGRIRIRIHKAGKKNFRISSGPDPLHRSLIPYNTSKKPLCWLGTLVMYSCLLQQKIATYLPPYNFF